MSYLDDLRECTYVAPSGARFALQFDDVSRDGGKKAVVHELPQQDRVEVQDLGNLGIHLPMTLYISGEDYHLTADDFFLALSERYTSDRPGELKHPRWGDILVCPITWTQAEGFVEGIGQAVFTVEFARVDRVSKFPTVGTDTASQLAADSADNAANTAAAFAERGVPTTPGEIANQTAQASNVLTTIGSALSGLASSAEDLGAQFNADLNTALGSVDALVAAPADLADAIISLARAPAEAVLAIGDKVTQYRTMIETMGLSVVNSYAEAELLLLSLNAGCIGATEATLSGDLASRTDAVDASDDIDAIMTAFNALLEHTSASLGWLPDPQTVADTMAMLSTCRARLLETSFSLKVERHYIVPGPIDPCSLIKKLTGTFSDAALDQAIADNGLSDEDIFMVPAAFDWVWYA